MYVLKIDFPNLPKGAPVDIDGLGRFENGHEYEISKEEAETYRLQNVTQSFEHDKDGNLLVETKKGPTLLQAFKNNDNVDVSTTDGGEDDDEGSDN